MAIGALRGDVRRRGMRLTDAGLLVGLAGEFSRCPASYVPARRATRVDPAIALRAE